MTFFTLRLLHYHNVLHPPENQAQPQTNELICFDREFMAFFVEDRK